MPNPGIRCELCGRRAGACSRGFSLVEVTLALGVVAVAMLALVALVPTGLGIQTDAIESQRAAGVVQGVESAIRAQIPQDDTAIYQFGTYLQVRGEAVTWRRGGSIRRLQFYVCDDGTLEPATNGPPPAKARQKLRLEIEPAQRYVTSPVLISPVRVWASVAWPASARWSGGRWHGARGSAETVIFSHPDAW